MFGVIMPLCNRIFCCIFGWYFCVKIRLKGKKIILLSSSRAFSLSTPTFLFSTPVATWKKGTKCNKIDLLIYWPKLKNLMQEGTVASLLLMKNLWNLLLTFNLFYSLSGYQLQNWLQLLDIIPWKKSTLFFEKLSKSDQNKQNSWPEWFIHCIWNSELNSILHWPKPNSTLDNNNKKVKLKKNPQNFWVLAS